MHPVNYSSLSHAMAAIIVTSSLFPLHITTDLCLKILATAPNLATLFRNLLHVRFLTHSVCLY